MGAKRTHTSAIVACLTTIVLAACGGGGDGDGGGDPTGPAQPQPPAGNPLLGGWSGSSSQGQPFHLLVNADGIVLAMIGYRVVGATCTDGIVSFVPREPPDAPFPLTNGAFTISRPYSGGTWVATGTLNSSGSASGTLAVTSTRCSASIDATWTATRASTAEINLSGAWNGTLQSNLVSATAASMTLSQTGSTLTGSYSVGAGAAGTVSGTVSGRMITFSLTQTTATCRGTFNGHAVVMPSPELLVLYYTGTDCLGAHRGSGTATRQ